MAELKWIKIVTDIFDNRKIKMVESLPQGDSILVIWLKILCLAGKCNEQGSLMLTDNIPYTLDMLVNEFGRSINVIKLALTTFEKLNMIEVIDDIYQISGWSKYQNVEQIEKGKELNRLRQQRYRERKALENSPENNGISNVTNDVTNNTGVTPSIAPPVTLSNALEVEEEKRSKNEEVELEKEEKNNKKDNISSFQVLISSYTKNEILCKELLEHLKTRKAKKATLTIRAIELSLEKLDQLSKNDEEKIAIVRRSIENGWTGFFALPDGFKPIIKKYDSGEIL